MRAETGGHMGSKWKVALLSVITVILVLRIGYIFLGDATEKEYITSCLYDLNDAVFVPCESLEQEFIPRQNRLNSVELQVQNPTDEDLAVVLSIYRGEVLLPFHQSLYKELKLHRECVLRQTHSALLRQAE